MIFHVLFLTLALGIFLHSRVVWLYMQADVLTKLVYKIYLFFLLCNFVTAAALFYLAELVEEYTVLTAKVIKGMLVVSRSAFAVFVCVKYLS